MKTERQRLASAQWRAKYPERNKEAQRRSREQRQKSGKTRWASLKWRYELTRAMFLTLLREQHFLCAICGVFLQTGERESNVDHDHVTGAVRGILCGRCNKMIGLAGDNKETLGKAIKYLDRGGC